MRMFRPRLLCLLGCFAVLAGCQQQSPAPEVAPVGSESSATIEPTSTHPLTGGAAADPHTLGSTTPEAAVRNALAAVQAGKLQNAYDFLPKDYQSDVDTLVHNFANRMDPELWEELFVTLGTGVKVLREQKDLILEMMQSPEQAEQQAQLAKNWDSMVDTLEFVVDSDLARLEKLKEVSTREFLGTTGNKLLTGLRQLGSAAGQNPIDQLGQAEVQLISNMGETALVSLKFPNDPAPQEVEFVQVNGRWIPKTLASSWSDSMESAINQIDSMTPEVIAGQKGKVMQMLGMVNGVFEQMLAAKTTEEFQGAAFPLLLQGMQLQSLFTPQQRGPSDGVMLIIDGELGDEAYTKLLTDLEQLTDNPERATRSSSITGGQIIIELRPVEDPIAFAEKLTLGQEKQVDAKTRTIRLKLPAE